METKELTQYFKPGVRCHLIGIGGVSMAPLAEVLLKMGLRVSGSDMTENDNVVHLRALGIPVAVGQRAENVEGAACVIRTAAAREDNPEVAAARERGIPLFERAQAWGRIMQEYPNAVCISGTHGKTTTTGMATHIFMEAGRDPTVMIGGTLPVLKSGYRLGAGDTIVLESCEYCNSFLNFFPTVAVVLDIEAEHLDFFKDLADVQRSFRKFAELVPPEGAVVANLDDANTMQALEGIDRRLVTFGFAAGADMRIADCRQEGRKQYVTLFWQGAFYAELTLSVMGKHNAMNAAAAAAAAAFLGIPGETVCRGLVGFTGAARRFEKKGTVNGADVYDDYAHHPGEVKTLLDMVGRLGYRRILLAFQPHTYTRTQFFFEDFVAQLGRADKLFLAEIYAAREKNTIGISSADLAARIPGSVFCGDFASLADALRAEAGEGDLVLTVGAGDIYRVGEMLTKK